MRKITQHLKKFKNNQSGNVAMMFAVTSVLLVSGVGIAIETNSLHSQRNELQNHLDATVLALVASGITDPTEQIEFVNLYVEQNDYAVPLNNLTIQLLDPVTGGPVARDRRGEIDAPNGYEIVLNANITPETHFADLLGFNSNVAGQSGATVGGTINEPIDMVLVLDTTASMAGTKIETLKRAAKDLISSIPDDADVKMGVVPFSSYVNVGLENRNEPWMFVDEDRQETFDAPRNVQISGNICLDPGRNGDRVDFRDGVAFLTDGTLCNNAQHAVFEQSEEITTRTTTFLWNGCVEDRWEGDGTLHLKDEQYNFPIRGNLRSTCAEPLTPLTDKKTELTLAINDLVAFQDTYMPAGIMWGRRVLSPQVPFEGGREADEVRKIMVLMTDGKNSMHSRRFGDHVASLPTNQTPDHNLDITNEETSLLCELAKEDGTEIFSIAFEVNDATTRGMLEACATDSSKYFNATNSAKLIDAFEEITESLITGEGIRISR